jgi:ribonuclease VapC
MVIDTSAMVALLRDEPEAQAILDALIAPVAAVISTVTLLEARTVLLGRFGPAMLQGLEDLLADLRPEVEPFDAEQSRLAFAAYRRFGKGFGHPARLNLCDCAAYALATSLDLPLLFKGDDFRRTDVRAALAG